MTHLKESVLDGKASRHSYTYFTWWFYTPVGSFKHSPDQQSSWVQQAIPHTSISEAPLFFQLDEGLRSLNELYCVLLDVKHVKPEVAYSIIAIFTETREALLKYSHKKVSMFYGYIP